MMASIVLFVEKLGGTFMTFSYYKDDSNLPYLSIYALSAIMLFDKQSSLTRRRPQFKC